MTRGRGAARAGRFHGRVRLQPNLAAKRISLVAKLLYVDDEVLIGKAVARWFERRGHTVRLAITVGSAKEAIAQDLPDVMFIDVWLGAESGFELMSWIEETYPALASRVTFVTGELADSTQSTRIWRTLGRPVLQKPFDFADLERSIADAERRNGT